MTLKTELAGIDRQLARARPDTLARLRKGAAKAALGKLSKKVFGGKPVPEDLVTWFEWHDGQEGHASVSPSDNRKLMSIDEVIDAHAFLNDPSEEVEGWKASWVPILANGAGDHVVYETATKGRGSLIGYWHADEDRDVEAKSLLAWATATSAALAKLPAAKAAAALPTLTAPKKPKWSAAKKPTLAQLQKREIGTVFRFEHVPVHMGKPKQTVVLVKIGEGEWCFARVPAAQDALATIARALGGSGTLLRRNDQQAHESFGDMSRWTGAKVVKHDELFETRVTIR
jgi:cell wall assembly regulator SMI1